MTTQSLGEMPHVCGGKRYLSCHVNRAPVQSLFRHIARMASPALDFSFVVPLHHPGVSLRTMLGAFRAEAMTLQDSWELILVDDGSADGTFAEAKRLTQGFPAPVILVEMARHFGEHAAVLEGWRQSRGQFVANLDGDLQHSAGEARRLLEHLRQNSDLELVYGVASGHSRSWWQRVGGCLVNASATLLLAKPHNVRLSSFRAVHRTLVERLRDRRTPFAHVDGYLLSATNRIGMLEIARQNHVSGGNGRVLGKLKQLVSTLLFDFSIMPLRLASLLGLAMSAGGALVLTATVVEVVWFGARQAGWASLMGVAALFGGAQMLMLGVVGEYVGRTFMSVSGQPQSLVREVITLPSSAAVAASQPSTFQSSR